MTHLNVLSEECLEYVVILLEAIVLSADNSYVCILQIDLIEDFSREVIQVWDC